MKTRLEQNRQKIVKMHQYGFNINEIARMYKVDRMTILKRFKKWNEPISISMELKDKEILLLTEDGHRVRSSYEVVIDNFLYKNSIKHETEKLIGLGRCKSDFYLDDFGVHIEFWGSVYRSDFYFKKLKFYRSKGIKLYSIYPFEDLFEKLVLLEGFLKDKNNRIFNAKPRLWYFPLERLPERYTVQLHGWLERSFIENGIDFEVVEKHSAIQRISKGQVLDFINTIVYKCEQNVCFSEKLYEFKEGDKLFFSDLWYPQLMGIIYPMVQMGLNVDIYGLIHAGSWDDFDFLARCGMNQYVSQFEKSIFRIARKVFVGSDFHKNLIIQKLNLSFEDQEKIVVTGMPFQYKDIKNMVSSCKKEHQIIFPSRFNMEKDPILMLEIMKEVLTKDRKVKLVITTSHKSLNCEYPFMIRELETFRGEFKNRVIIKSNLTKRQYYEQLAKSKIVLFTSKQETFGYCLAEGVTLGCTPICPNKLSYVDVLDRKEYLYDNKEEAVEKILFYLENPKPILNHFQKYENNIKTMLREMELVS